ncbi:MAG TPA: M28 family peptidase [Vicinamibacterales bacterium]
MRRTILTACVLVFLVSVATAQRPLVPDAVRAAADTITADGLKRDLDYLSSDELLGRQSPSPGFDKAADYIAKRLAKAGLKPLGDNGTYLQHYMMRESRVDTGAASLEIGGTRFKFGTDFVLRSFAGPVSGARKAVYVGHGWTVADKGIDPFAGVDVKGKLVVAHAQRAMPKDVEIRQIGRISVGGTTVFAEAERRGAAGVIFLAGAPAGASFEQMANQNTTRREIDPNVPSAYASIPVTSALLARPAVDALFAGERVAAADVLAAGESRNYPPSFELAKSITLNVPLAEQTEHRPFNVVAMIEGTDPALKGEYVTIASHLDGAVGTRTVEGDAIYNAADDNASGSAGNLAIAETMMRVKPRRSVIFIWDSGEERGLWGTRYFVGMPPVPLKQIVTHFNVDMIAANRAPGSPDEKVATVAGDNEVYVVGPRVLSAKGDALVEAVNAAYLKMKFNRDDDTSEKEFFYPRTDASPFLERGILTIDYYTGLHPRYHLPSDEARFLDPRKMEAITRTLFATIWAFADATERPGIDKPIPPTVLPFYK